MANLKAGTLIGGNLIWNAGNLPLRTSAKNLYIEDAQVYTTAFKPTPADVNAVAKSGDTMTGDLIAPRLLATNEYAVRNSRDASMSLYMDPSAKRTILSGGDSTGFVVIRPIGVGNTGSNTTFNADGTITASADGTASAHLTRKSYVDNQDGKRVAKAGDTMTGRLVLNYTSSMRVPVGTSDQRGSSETGSFRFNTNETSFEGYDGAEWQPIGSGRVKFTNVTANTTAKKGKGYLVDTTKSGIVVTLPADANDGDFVVIGDGAGNANKNVFYVAGYNGDRIIIDRDNCMLRFSKFGTKWVISDGIGEAGAIDAADYMKLSGGAFTGDVKMGVGKKLSFPTTTYATGAQIYTLNADQYGSNLIISSGGVTVVGSGESAVECAKTITNNEKLYLTSDSDIHFAVNGNTWANKVEMTLSAAGRLDIPNGLTVRGASSHVDLIETDSSNKQWRMEGSGGNFAVTEVGVGTRLTLKAGGGADVSGRVSASAYSASTAGNAYTTGKTSDGSYAAVSAESGYVMLWKRNDSDTKADEFIGISTSSRLQFRQDNGTGDRKYTDHMVYHSGHKPTPSDIGAVPSSGRHQINMTLGTKTQNSWDYPELRNYDYAGFYRCNGHDDASGHTMPSLMIHCPHSNGKAHARGIGFNYAGWDVWTTSWDKDGNYQGLARIYTEKNKPTAADVGLGNVVNKGWNYGPATDTYAVRDGSGDLQCRLLRSTYADQNTISGAIAYRINNGSDNYTRYCSDINVIRNWLNAQSKSDIRSNSMNNTQTTIPATESGDMNAQIAGYYGLYNGSKVANSPYNNYFYCETKSIYSTGALLQTAWPYDDQGGIFYRNYSMNSKSWTPWREIYSERRTGPVDINAIFACANGWTADPSEFVAIEYPTHYHIQGIFRGGSAGHVGDFRRNVRFSYIPYLIPGNSTVYAERVPNGKSLVCNAAAGQGWIMINMIAQKM